MNLISNSFSGQNLSTFPNTTFIQTLTPVYLKTVPKFATTNIKTSSLQFKHFFTSFLFKFKYQKFITVLLSTSLSFSCSSSTTFKNILFIHPLVCFSEIMKNNPSRCHKENNTENLSPHKVYLPPKPKCRPLHFATIVISALNIV